MMTAGFVIGTARHPERFADHNAAEGNGCLSQRSQCLGAMADGSRLLGFLTDEKTGAVFQVYQRKVEGG